MSLQSSRTTSARSGIWHTIGFRTGFETGFSSLAIPGRAPIYESKIFVSGVAEILLSNLIFHDLPLSSFDSCQFSLYILFLFIKGSSFRVVLSLDPR